MLCNFNYLSSSLLSGNLKRLLPLPQTPYSILFQYYSIASYQAHPWGQANKALFLSRLRALVPVPDPSYLREPEVVLLFCSNALKASAKKGFLPEGKQLHAHLIKLGLYNVLSLQNQMLSVYLKCKETDDAEKLFEEFRDRNIVSWNIVIRGSNYGLYAYLGFSYFRRMMLEMVVPDDITFNSLICLCIHLNDIDMGRQLHSFLVKLGFDMDCFVASALVDLYAKCGLIEDARGVFNCVLYIDMVMWNVMISCYALNCLPGETCTLFNLMRLEGVNGDEFTFSSLLSSCGTSKYYEFGKQVHGLILRQSFDSDVLVASALLNMYTKNENVTDAHMVFEKMAIRNVVSWNTIIVGHGKCGGGNEVMELLRNMLSQEIYPDELTLSSILSSCGYTSTTSETMQAHACTIKLGFQEFLSVANALISAYSKCGSIANASQCFSLIVEPDLITWTSMINAYAFHGLAREATEMFEKMLSCGIIPDQVSFLCVLSACAHGGLVNMGLHYFKLMTHIYHIAPDSEHYACLIDLLGRCGLISEAFELLMAMPIEPDSNTLGAFIGSCKLHANMGLAKWVAEKLFKIEPKKTVNYTVMSHIYASQRHWSDAARVRAMIGECCNRKVPGYSWIEIADLVHSFVSSDKSHPQSPEIHATLKSLLEPMKEEIV
ncbi:hypothetical protein L6164_003909 [Bauhinia variegata]|uniref:Uncharacterized protein n=1 Tax=Bauhinia variegata TaxID=167791 RepID=A0ACB9Q4A0_BAUVA|nr:hypothetical protein L6164_003909 [Bauhinia variegata]